MQLKFVLCMIKYKIKHKIVNYCEKIESVTSHDLYPLPLSQTVTLSQTPSPLERDILYGRPLIDRSMTQFVGETEPIDKRTRLEEDANRLSIIKSESRAEGVIIGA